MLSPFNFIALKHFVLSTQQTFFTFNITLPSKSLLVSAAVWKLKTLKFLGINNLRQHKKNCGQIKLNLIHVVEAWVLNYKNIHKKYTKNVFMRSRN